MVRLGASAQPIVLRVKTRNPAISGMRRPKRSDSVPWVIWPTARPANQVARVSCAVPGCGAEGGLHGREGGQIHVGRGRADGDEQAEQRCGSQVGWVARVETWMLILGWSYGWVWMNVVPGWFLSCKRCGENADGVKGQWQRPVQRIRALSRHSPEARTCNVGCGRRRQPPGAANARVDSGGGLALVPASRPGGVPEWLKGADCKSAGVRLRWFESNPLHQSNCPDLSDTCVVVAVCDGMRNRSCRVRFLCRLRRRNPPSPDADDR